MQKKFSRENDFSCGSTWNPHCGVMVQNQSSSKTGASPVTSESATKIVVPAAFEAHDPSIKGATLALAIQVGERHPQIVQAAIDFKKSFAESGEKYYQLLHTLRHAKLPKKEATALLLGLGFPKGRASELNKLSSAKDEVWAKYSGKAISFRAALALEDGKPEKGEGSGNEGDKPSGKKKAKIHALPKPMQIAFAGAAEPWLSKDSTLPKPMKSGNRTEYGFTYEANGVTLYFQIFADKAE